MTKLTIIIAVVLAVILFSIRFAISTSGFFQEGIMEGIQACRSNDDCVWVGTGCCSCESGGGEMLINKNNEFLFKLLIKDICLGEESCAGEYACHDYDLVHCAKTCKFGKREPNLPLLVR